MPPRAPQRRRLYLLRHAKSTWDDPARSDFDRPLNKRGRRAASAVGSLLARRGPRPELALCSAAARAQETWRRLAAELPEEPPVRLLRSLYLAAPSRILDRIRAVEESVATLLLIGHSPGIETLAISLAGPGSEPEALARISEKYPTAALAGFEIEGPWAGIAAGRGRLVEFVVPKELG
ncbi:MAG: histidine phosphatase family protein [Tistlia sp.]|uniref:histidine phosphatase family protein n=1 Tax=Tistlia sp. TaxID=3057121 RepID=UPI0034A11F5C